MPAETQKNMQKMAVKNATWIIACRVVQSLLNLLVGMLTARYLGPSDYGVINYAASIAAFASPIMQLGLNSILVYEFVNGRQDEGVTLGTTFVLNLCSAILCVVGITAFTSIANAGEAETILVCFLYSLMLIAQVLEQITYWFQSKLLSKYTSLTMLCAYVVVSAYKVFLLITKKSIYWFAVSNAIDYLLIGIALCIIYKRLGGKSLRFSLQHGKYLLARSRYYIVSSLMVMIFAQTDKIMLKIMIGADETGFYSAAVACAGISSFVFAAIIDSVRPMILGYKGHDEAAYRKTMTQLYSIIIYLSLAQSAGMTLLADWIIRLLYGVQFAAAAPALRVIVWYTTFAYIGSVRNIWILAEERQQCLWIINLSGALMNVVLNFFLIQSRGVIGAAMASLLTQIFTNVILGFILPSIRGNNALMLAAWNPKELFSMLRYLRDSFRR